MEQYIIAHDLGTSGNKATLYSLDGRLVKSTVYSYELIVEKATYAEQRADDWWKAVCETTKLLLQDIPAGQIAAVSFSGQMMGCLCVDKEGLPLHNALIWADMRSTPQEMQIRERIDAFDFYRITGHRISPSYGVTKLMWLRDNVPQVYEKTYKMLNAKDYILFKLTGKFVTEHSDGASTCLMDLRTLQWSDELLELVQIPKEKMPQVLRSVDIAGTVTKEAAMQTGLLQGTPVVCGGGDGCCAAVGTGVVKEGVANCCLGTSSWISVATKAPVCDEKMTLFNWPHIVPGYILPTGTMQTGGGSLSWVVNTLYKGVDGFQQPDKASIYASVNKEVESSPLGAKNLLYLPHLMGERSPRWNEKAKGTFVGLTMGHDRADVLRSVMEGVGYNLDIILQTMLNSGCDIQKLITVGGGARNPVWLQILSDVFGLPLLIPTDLEEATSMGAAITAGVGIGAFDSFDVANKFVEIRKEQTPNYRNYESYKKYKPLFEKLYQTMVPIFDEL